MQSGHSYYFWLESHFLNLFLGIKVTLKHFFGHNLDFVTKILAGAGASGLENSYHHNHFPLCHAWQSSRISVTAARSSVAVKSESIFRSGGVGVSGRVAKMFLFSSFPSPLYQALQNYTNILAKPGPKTNS